MRAAPAWSAARLACLRPLLTLLLTLALASPVTAQVAPEEPTTEATAMARALFEEGLQLVDQKRWEEAADRFARVLDIRWSPVAAYNLATSLIELGALVEASEALRAVIRDASSSESMRESARRQLTAVERRIGKLRLDVSGDGVDVVITLDDAELPPAAWNVAVPVDPGTHRVAAYRGDRMVFQTDALVQEGSQREVVVPVRLSAAAPTPVATASTVAVDVAPLPPATEQPPERSDAASKGGMWWLWIGAGVLAAGALATVAILVASDAASEPPAPVAGDFEPGVLRGQVGAF